MAVRDGVLELGQSVHVDTLKYLLEVVSKLPLDTPLVRVRLYQGLGNTEVSRKTQGIRICPI